MAQVHAVEHSVPAMAAVCASAAVAALLPDVDHARSYIGRRLPGISHLVQWIFGHRTITHSLLGLAAFGVLAVSAARAWSVPDHVLAGAFLGYASHLASDAATPSGIPLFYPFSRRRYRLPVPAVPTGSAREALVLVIAAMASAGAVWNLVR